MIHAPIPRQIIQFWDALDRTPSRIQRAMQSWAQHPDHVCRVFDEAGARALLRESLPAEVTEAYDRAAHPVLKSDLFRYAALSVLGGIYVDADDTCLRFPREIIARSPGLTLVRKFNGLVSNSFIICTPGHPLLRAATLQTADNILRRVSNNIAEVSGPHVTDQLARACSPDALEILDFAEFRRYVGSSRPEGEQAHWSGFQERHSIFTEPIDPQAPGLSDMIEKIPVPASFERNDFLRSGHEDFIRLHRLLQRAHLYLAAFRTVAVLDDPGFRVSRWFFILQRTLSITCIHASAESIEVPAPLNFASQSERDFADQATAAGGFDLIIATRIGPGAEALHAALTPDGALIALGSLANDETFAQAMRDLGLRLVESKDAGMRLFIRRA